MPVPPISVIAQPVMPTPATFEPVEPIFGVHTPVTPTFGSPTFGSPTIASPTDNRNDFVEPVMSDTLKFRNGVLDLLDKECDLKMPFTSDLDAFIEHLDSCDNLATKTPVDLGPSAVSWKQTESERRRRIIASITVQKAAFLHPHINFMKDVLISTISGLSESSRKVLASFNLSFSPDVAKQKMKEANARASWNTWFGELRKVQHRANSS
ncbi:hypothetical protein DFS34DRAFT_606474 [Phlyctochytrium arcticum]|nr:hypothetical protein DFS34DRAFT_606474 [Phlyctochytrium arcticum]